MSGGSGMPPRRKAMPRRSTPDKRTPRYLESMADYRESKVQVWARDGGACVVQGPGCTRRGWEYHHRLPRGMGGASRAEDTHCASRLIVVCRNCHQLCESERTWAEAQGYVLRHGVVKPRAVPLLYRGQWAMLTVTGAVVHLCWRVDPTGELHCLRELGHAGNEHRDTGYAWPVIA